MGLRLKFNLVLLAVFVTGLAVTGYISYELLHRNAREEVLRNAGVMMEAALSMRSYTVGQVRPNLAVDPDKFLPQSVPAFGATEIMTLLRNKYPDYAYKEATLNPTNPRNRAVEWETDIVNAFRTDPSHPEISGMRETPTGRSDGSMKCRTVPNDWREPHAADYDDHSRLSVSAIREPAGY